MTKKIDKQIKIGILDNLRNFKSISLDIKTYKELFQLSKSINIIPTSIADVVRLLLVEYKNNHNIDLQKQTIISQRFLENKDQLIIDK